MWANGIWPLVSECACFSYNGKSWYGYINYISDTEDPCGIDPGNCIPCGKHYQGKSLRCISHNEIYQIMAFINF